MNYLITVSLGAEEQHAPARARIRLTSAPAQATALRVLGKAGCPVLGDYDEMPINGIESCLIAFVRGDMLLRQRQHGKAQMAMQEGAVLLAGVERAEVFQQASRHQIIPEDGFGADSLH